MTRPALAAAACVLLVLATASAQTPQVAFRFTAANVERTVSVAVLDQGGEPYVSLSELADKVGGGCRVTAARVQVDFAGHTAWMQFEKTDVDASLRRFSLLHPVLEDSGEALMAVSDLGPFFEKAFEAKLARETAPQPAPVFAPAPVRTPAAEETIPLPETPASNATQAPAPSPPTEMTGHGAMDVVIIDAGHGGNDTGCEGAAGAKEEDIALGIAIRLQRCLQATGVQALLTRDRDADVSQKERADFANSQDGDLLISIHAGASFSSQARGAAVFYSSVNYVLGSGPGAGAGNDAAAVCAARSQALAKALMPALTTALAMENRGVRELRCVLLDNVAMPSALVEAGFVTNAGEEALLSNEAFLLRIAEAIAAGIAQYSEKLTSGGAP